MNSDKPRLAWRREYSLSPLAALFLLVLAGLLATACGDAPEDPASDPRQTDGVEALLAPGDIATVMGTGEEGMGLPGGPGTATALAFPSGVGIDPDGRLLVADFKNHRVLRLEPDGIVTAVAGTGEPGESGDGGPAASARLSYPCGVAGDGQGGVLIVDTNNHLIRRVDGAGIVETVVDGLFFPEGVAVDGVGGIYIAEAGHYRVSRWSEADGLGVVLDEGLVSPYDVAVHPDGRLLIADYGGHRVMAVSPEGSVGALAGTGERGFDGDGGPAEAALLAGPQGVAVGPSGEVYVADTGNHRVRRVGLDGQIHTVAGTGEAGFGGDGGPALSAQLAGPSQVAVAPTGLVFVADAENHRVRAFRPLAVLEPFPASYTVTEATGVFQGVEATAGPDGVELPDGSTLAIDGTVSFDADGRFVADLEIRENGALTVLSTGGFTRFEGSFRVHGDTLSAHIADWGVTKAFGWTWEAGARRLVLDDITEEGAVPMIHGDVYQLILTQDEERT